MNDIRKDQPNPTYLVNLEDSDGDKWEVDINNETDIEYLVSLRPLLSEKCVIIREQLEVTAECDGNAEWTKRARCALKHSERHIRAIDRRISYLRDPTGELRAISIRKEEWHSKNKTELEGLKHFLSTNYPDALSDWDELTGGSNVART